MSNWLWTGYKRPWVFVNCILCEINNRKDYSNTLLAKYFLLQALNCDVHSASEPTATRLTFEPTFGSVTRVFASPAPTAQEPSRGTTRSGVTFSASIEICPEGFQQSLIRLAWCRIRFAASQLQLRQSSRIKKRHAVLRWTTTTSERCPLNPESKKTILQRAFSVLNSQFDFYYYYYYYDIKKILNWVLKFCFSCLCFYKSPIVLIMSLCSWVDRWLNP